MTTPSDTETQSIEFVAEFYGVDAQTAIDLYKDEIEAYEFFIQKEQE